MMPDITSTDLPGQEQLIKVNLLGPLKFTMPLLEQHGCKIEREELNEPFPAAALKAGDITYWVVFPTGARREEKKTHLPHARCYLITLPDGSIFDENYHLDFHQSTISEPPPPPRYR